MASWLEPSEVLFWLLCFENISPSSRSLLSAGLAAGQNYFLWPTCRCPSSSAEVWRRARALSTCFTVRASCSLWLRAGASFYLFLNSVGLHWISSWPSEGMTLHLEVAHLNLLIPEVLENCLASSFFLKAGHQFPLNVGSVSWRWV